ncbi:MAG: DUF1549 domain-containing protein [Bryobacteraceae bacterium]|nr:DUF1549 domain-containing protein [Bryobacteraceae bacterium]
MRNFVLALLCALPSLAQSGDAFFEKNIRPLFVSKCLSCHTGASPAGGLALDSREHLLKGGTRGPSLVPGNPATSLLIRAVRHSDGKLKMPPGPKLSDAEAALLAQWVEMGAPWGAASTGAASGKFWSFVPPSDSPAPIVKNAAWVRNPVDAFLLSKLEEKSLTPAPPADKRTLIRRATYDLTGLPPSPEEVREFLADTTPQAFQKVVDRLLSSPRYGERWGRHWLDVARYADSNGLDENLVYRHAWRYRDYVIQAFNNDKPYDQFLREQLAGDLMPVTNSSTDFERWTATGFLSLGAKMLAEDDPVKMEMDIIDEQLDTVGRTFMGLTVGCARCHDHKFDPVPQADYYSLAGIFKSTRTMENFKVVAKWHEHVLAPKQDRDHLDAHLAKIEAKSKESAAIARAANEKLTAEAKRKAGAYLLAAHQVRETPKLKPLSTAAPVLMEREAGAFDEGNVSRSIERKKPNVPKDSKGPYFAEYHVSIPAAGDYQIELLDEERGAGTADLWIGGVLVKGGEGAVQNREASPDAGGWSPLGIFALESGRNTLKLQHKRRFPYFAKLRIAASPLPAGQPVPRTIVQIARRYDVNPSILQQMVEHLERSKGAPASVLYAFENFGLEKPDAPWTSPAAKLFEGFRAATREDVAARYQQLFTRAMEQPEGAGNPALDSLNEFLKEKFGPFRAPGDAREYYPADARAALERLELEQKELEKATPDYPRAMGVRENDTIADLPIHIRGSHINLGEKVPRRFLRAIAGENQQPIGPQTSGRLQLAQWLTGKEHPLTARVMVNRIWRWHFGRGIVATTDNFGRLGEKPTNQPLLDWLALRFVESGWSIKAMHRLMMSSNAYQMSSAWDARSFEADPENALLWRANRRRLEAEAIRDGIMAVSGGLDLATGGTILSYKDRQYVANTSQRGGVDYDRNIRAVYIPVVRSSMYEVFTAFDLPDPSTPQGDRDATIVAPQALFMMNGAVVLRHSKTMAERLLAMPGADAAARVRQAYELAFARPPSAGEIDQALTFVASVEKALPAESKDRQISAWQSLCKSLMASNEFIYLN